MKRFALHLTPLALAISLVLTPLIGCSNGGASAANPTAAPTAVATATPTPEPPAPSYSYKVIHTYPHDKAAFTQGLLVDDGVFYESTGLNGKSSLRKVEIETGKVLQKKDVASEYFAEGLAELNDKLYQLTWQSKVGFVYDQANFNKTGDFSYDMEGWGLTTDGTDLILSDGTDKIRFLDPKTFQVKRTISVVGGGTALDQLNELEYIDGEIYANVWKTNSIVRIDPQTGKVVGWIDMTGILPTADATGADVLNGIAYDKTKKRLFVTGKLWPKLFEIELVKQ
jgi:glutaminyl-peptide cyclotransferase